MDRKRGQRYGIYEASLALLPNSYARGFNHEHLPAISCGLNHLFRQPLDISRKSNTDYFPHRSIRTASDREASE